MRSHPLTGAGSVAAGVLEGETVQFATCSRIRNTLREGAKLAGVRTIWACPCCAKGCPIGVIPDAPDGTARSPTSRSSWSTTFADQAVIAIENVRLFDEVQARTRELSEALEQQTATSEVLQVISSSPGELEPVFQAMLANATRICEAEFGIAVPVRRGWFPARRAPRRAACISELRQRDP